MDARNSRYALDVKWFAKKLARCAANFSLAGRVVGTVVDSQPTHMNTEIKKEEPATDPDLIRDTLDGKSNAFGTLVLKYQPKFLAMATRILGNQAEAED